MTVPKISAALDDQSRGFKKAARILLAAHLAVSTKIADDMLTRLKEVAELAS